MAKYDVKVVGQVVKEYHINAEDREDAIEDAILRFESDFAFIHADRRFPDEGEWDLTEVVRCEEIN